MANYYGEGRSNYVHVTDLDKVTRIAKLYQLTVNENDDDTTLICFLAEDPDGGGEANNYVLLDEDENKRNEIKELITDEDLDGDDYELPSFFSVIHPYLLDGEVLIWLHVGNEKLRYLNGYAAAINNKGEEETISLSDIYEKAKRLGSTVTQAEY